MGLFDFRPIAFLLFLNTQYYYDKLKDEIPIINYIAFFAGPVARPGHCQGK